MTMKIDEFIKKVNQVKGTVASRKNDDIMVGSEGRELIYQIPEDATNFIEIETWVTSNRLYWTKPDREYLSTLIEEFLHTPVKERFPGKKYTVQVFPVDDGYLNMDDNGYVCTDDIDQICGTRTQFTQQEIDSFKQRDDIAIDWNKAKIKEAKD